MRPVDLGGLAGGEGQRQIGRPARRSHRAHILLEDAVAAGVAVLVAQLLEELRGTVRVAFQPAHDQRLEGVELARALAGAAAREGLHAGVAGDRFGIDAQFERDLVEGQSALAVVEPDLAVGLVGDHDASSMRARRMSPARRTPPSRGAGAIGALAAATGAGPSRLSTW